MAYYSVQELLPLLQISRKLMIYIYIYAHTHKTKISWFVWLLWLGCRFSFLDLLIYFLSSLFPSVPASLLVCKIIFSLFLMVFISRPKEPTSSASTRNLFRPAVPGCFIYFRWKILSKELKSTGNKASSCFKLLCFGNELYYTSHTYSYTF